MRTTSILFIVALALLMAVPVSVPAATITTNIAYAKRDVSPQDFFPDDTANTYIIRGRITSPDFNPTVGGIPNLQVYFQDTNDDVGICMLFDPNEDFNEYTKASELVLGHEVEVTGFIGQFNGNRYIKPSIPDSDIVITDTNPVYPTPVLDTITNLLQNAEDYEGTLVVITNVTYTGTWPNPGQNGFLTADDGTASMDLFIDEDTNIAGQLPPTNAFTLQGIFSQYDTNAIPNADYQILPRFFTDIIQDVPADSPPSLVLSPSGTALGGVGSELTIQMLGQDRNVTDTLTFSKTGVIGTVTDLGIREAVFTWTPPPGSEFSTNDVTLTVSDGLTVVSSTVTVIVQPIPTNFWDFEGWIQGWTTYSVASSADWENTDAYPYDPGAEGTDWSMDISGYQADTASDDWLISPPLDLSSYDSPEISYYRYTYYNGPLPKLWVSTTYPGTGDPTAYFTTDLGMTDPPAWSDWFQEVKSLAAYAGNPSVYVAFQYTSEGPLSGQGRDWRIDQVRLGEAPANDPPVFVAPIGDQVVFVGDTLSLEVVTTEIDGDPVTITTNAAPANSTFTDNTDGTADYTFTPDGSQVGTQIVSFVASDNDGEVTNTINLLVFEPITANTLWDFEQGVAPWFAYNRLSDNNWERRNFTQNTVQGAEGSSWYMYMNGFGANTNSDDWLISPKIDLTAFTDPELLYHLFRRFSGPDMTLKISTDYPGSGDPALATWSSLGLTVPVAEQVWEPSTNNLSAYTAYDSVYLAFHYTSVGTASGEAALWEVDQIRLREVPVNEPPEISPVLVDKVVTVSNTLVFSVTTVEPDGDPITIVDVPSLANSSLTSNSNGNATYSFTPVAGQIGDHVVSFIASDVDGADTNTITITVLPPSSDGSGMIISEVVDGTISAGNPKFVEITNTDDLDYTFTGGGIVVQANAATDYTIDVDLTGITILAGQSFVIQSLGNGGSNVFYDTYGFDADLYTSASFSNGDDRYILASADDGNGVATAFLDIHGEDGVDGTGTAWEYLDGYAYRLPPYVTGNGLGFVLSEWFHSGVDALDGADQATMLALTTPGTHDYVGAGPVDSDGDGMFDDDEIFAGTNPNDSNSFFAVSAIVATPDIDITLRDTTTARVYQVEFTIDISDPNSWSNLAPAVVGTEPDTVITDTSGDIDRNYRGKVMMP